MELEEEATMSDAETCRRYAKDCLRLAGKMSASDKQVLLKIAEAWEARAREAEQKRTRSTSATGDMDGAGAP
jgi:hypothetical protein